VLILVLVTRLIQRSIADGARQRGSRLLLKGHIGVSSLFQVSVNNLDELFGASGSVPIAFTGRITDVHSHVVFEQFGHQTIRCAAHGNDQLHHVIAAFLRLERALDSFDLTAQTTDAV